ncbi:uncharacterized protein EHS24_005800 [Apiotrichum porosum]|uniref:Uncharacterized protein n=1 Tax=Apiotrichum porosum TaxID=105984 RepID=A0A427XZW9_9TREE|nr:uncharacterized protein EHS24_005800 [Apiotrichum porosum]RSH84285.1 hypothetical protein EHS24_005800 [Apiotrichum porosum]
MATSSPTPSTILPTLEAVTIHCVKLDPLDLNDEKVRSIIREMPRSVATRDSKTNDKLEELRAYLWSSQSNKVLKRASCTRNFRVSGNTHSGYLNRALSQHFSEMTGVQGPEDGITHSLHVFIRKTPLIEGATYLSVDPNEAYGTATRDTAFWISFTKQVTQGLGVQCPIPIDSNPPPPEVTGYWLQLAPLQHRDGLELDLPTRAANDQLKGMLAVHKRYEIEAGFLFSLGDEVTAAEGLPPAYDYSDIRHGLVSQHGPVIGQIHYATPDSVFLNWGHTDQVAKRIQRSLDAYQDDSDA